MNILYIEDNFELSETIKNKLKSKYNIDIEGNGVDGVKKTEGKEYDLIILDYFLPDMTGLEICKKIREYDKKTPILIFTTNENKEDIVNALDAGADDYLTKPFDFNELEARIRTLIRRNNINKEGKVIKLGNLLLDTSKQLIICNKQILELSRQEYLLLKYILINKGKLVSRQELYEHVWGDENYYNSNTIDVHIKRIRNKIKEVSDESYIRSIYGLGYRTENIK